MSSSVRFLVISSLFFCSGAVGLVYEVVWSRQLQVLFGSTAFSVSAVLTAFFSGMALGSYCLGKWGNRGHPLRVYALLEIGLGLYIITMPVLMRSLDRIFLYLAPSLTEHFLTAQGVKLLLSLVVLIIPCTLMGGTLPVLSRAVADSDGREGAVGLLYAMNTLGAVTGAAVAGFYLIEHFGMSRLLLAGAILNAVLGLMAVLLSYRIPHRGPGREESEEVRTAGDIRLPLAVYAVSGFCALAG